MQLRQDVRGVSLERLLRNRPVFHGKQHSVLLEDGVWERVIRNVLKASSARGACPAVASRARVPLYNVCRDVGDCGEYFLQRQTQGLYLRNHHCPVKNSHRIDDISISRGQM